VEFVGRMEGRAKVGQGLLVIELELVVPPVKYCVKQAAGFEVQNDGLHGCWFSDRVVPCFCNVAAFGYVVEEHLQRCFWVLEHV
jgi:hypothetical protein